MCTKGEKSLSRAHTCTDLAIELRICRPQGLMVHKIKFPSPKLGMVGIRA